jgi:hypothetical protein
MEHARLLGQNLRMKDVEEREEIQTKVIDNLFSRIVAENCPNIEKERVTQVQEAYRTPNCQDQKRNTQHREQRKNSESCKREKPSHI